MHLKPASLIKCLLSSTLRRECASSISRPPSHLDLLEREREGKQEEESRIPPLNGTFEGATVVLRSGKGGTYRVGLMLGWGSSKKEISDALSIVELLVHMDCEGCEKRVRRAVSKIDGKILLLKKPSETAYFDALRVDSVEVDMGSQKVTVTGYVDQRKVLKVVRRTGRKAEFWPYPYDSEYYPYAAQYLDESTFSTTYNYYRHGFNESIHGYFPDQAYSTVDDNTVFMFSDDNVHACTVM